MSSGVAVASTQDWTIIRFSAGKRHRYRFRKKDSSAGVPEIESRFSDQRRLHSRGSVHAVDQFYGILGIVWDVESKDWDDALTHLDPNEAFLLVKWKDYCDTWERASDVLTLRGPLGRKGFLRQLARKQEDYYKK
jgi:hypothetical protein